MRCRRCLLAILPIAIFALGGCVGPFGWRSNPPWLTPHMGKGELASELAKNIPLGATREDVLVNLEERGVKPFAEIRSDGDSGGVGFTVSDSVTDPQFEYAENRYNHHFAYLDENYFVERDNRIAILVGSYRATPPMGTMVTWAMSIEGEVIVTIEDDIVRAVMFRPLDSDISRNEIDSFKIESLR